MARAAQVCKMWRLVFSSPIVWFKLGAFLIFRRFSKSDQSEEPSDDNDNLFRPVPDKRKDARASVRIPYGPIEYNEQTGQIATATTQQLVNELVKETATVSGNYHGAF